MGQTGPLLSAAHRDLVDAILAEHLPSRHVRVFGSRAHGRGLKRWSDLDLVVMGAEPLAPAAAAALAAAFDDSDLPFRVDVLDWCDAPSALRTSIEAEGWTWVGTGRPKDAASA
jgi:predicted nucleotidyltransferase